MDERMIKGPSTPLSPSKLAAELVDLERSLSAEPPRRLVLGDDSDACLAAALVAAKLLIPVALRPGASERSSTNSRLIALLAATYTPGR